MTSDPLDALLRNFVREGRLIRLPAKEGKRRPLLQHIAATTFEPDTEYSEPEVDKKLKVWCEGGDADHASLRRHLITEGLLTRADGIYRRA